MLRMQYAPSGGMLWYIVTPSNTLDALKYSRDVDGTPLALEHFDQVASKQTGDASSAGYGSQTDYSLQDQFNFLQKNNSK